jgi:ABC-type Zn uptake system ZnuABC Zn-binding protein ZnuA
MLKKIFVPLMLSVACALLLTACGGSDNTSTTNTTNTTAANKSVTTTSTPSTTTPTSTPATTTPASGDKVGVPECDDYLAKYEACLSKVPEAGRAQYQAAFAQVRKSWRDLAANPQTKASLAQACKMASDQAKSSMKTYGCEF